MAYTGQNICDRIREQINDSYKREIQDSELLNYVNDCVKVVYNKRPDYFIGSYSSFPADLVLGTSWTLDEKLLPAIIDYAVSMSQRPDDEDAQAGQSAACLAKFTAAL